MTTFLERALNLSTLIHDSSIKRTKARGVTYAPLERDRL